MERLYTALIAAVIAIVGALTTYIVNTIKNKDIKKRIDTLEEFIASDNTEYYIHCPYCNKKIILNKVKILINKEQECE